MERKDVQAIERRLRLLAAKFTGVAMGHRLPATDHGSSRDVVVSVLDEAGVAHELGDELLDIAGEVARLAEPTTK